METVRAKVIINSPSKTLASALAVFCFGIALGPLAPVLWWKGLLLGTVAVLALVLFVTRPLWRFACILLAIFLFAVFRYTQAALPAPGLTVAQAPASEIRVSGVIDAEVERRASHQRLVLDGVQLADTSAEGRLLVWAPLYPEFSYGDELIFNCRVDVPEPFEGFDYPRYLASQGILGQCDRPNYIDVVSAQSLSIAGALLSFKRASIHRLERLVPAPHAALISGLLFGGNSSLSSDLKDDFSATGTSHILAASGFNVSLFSLVFLSWILGTRLKRPRALALVILLILAYVVIAGATPAVMRAGLMGGVVVLSHSVNRRASIVNVMLATAALMLLHNPLILWADVGFQLSFVATAAVLGLTPTIEKRLTFIPKTLEIRKSFAASIGAIILTLPIILWHFGQVSVIAPLANLLVLPLVTYAMGVSIIALLLSLISTTLGTLMGVLSWALAQVMLWFIVSLGALEWAVLDIGAARFMAVVVAVILFLTWFHHRYARTR